ncbi:XRE family transcriptional regulator [Lysinibacillus fusiformis]|uniref:XRE family transcriptional regulator n=1 Tax=Lysinibacillus fusiformis TaxID=28031 RepID=UPI00148D9314|nr:XRE family transcriptional regulator [Lysinibacillus fusiformis]NOG28501.1 XRE family transcriptional regulator [Lysinibacillus fusiformis]
MSYHKIVSESIAKKQMSLKYISKMMKNYGVVVDPSYLSKLKNGKKTPASEEVNNALAKVLDIDPMELKVAAYREKIPKEILERLLIS